MIEMPDAFVHRHPTAQSEDRDGHDQRPEVKFFPMAKRVCEVGRSPALAQSVQEQRAVACIDQRVDTFRQHRRTAGERGGDELGNGNGDVPDDGRHNRDFGFCCSAL